MLNLPILNKAIETRLAALTMFDFQEFIISMLRLQYGVSDIQDIRPIKDNGADSLIKSEQCCVACYAPSTKKSFSAFSKKTKDDYEQYIKNWKDDYPTWKMYINWEPSPEEIKLVCNIGSSCDLWGLKRIIHLIDHLPWGYRTELFRLLAIDDDMIGRDYLRKFLDDLVNERVLYNTFNYKKKAPDIKEKIECNYTEASIQEALHLAHLTVEQQAAASETMEAYSEVDLHDLKAKVLFDFSCTPSSASFSDRMHTLAKQYNYKYNSIEDDGFSLYILGFLIVLFSQCLFGNEPKKVVESSGG